MEELLGERRGGRRARTDIEAVAVADDGRVIGRCVVQNVSGGGAQLRVGRELALPAHFRLRFAGRAEYDAQLTWRRGQTAGVRLLAQIDDVAAAAERLAGDLQELRRAADRGASGGSTGG